MYHPTNSLCGITLKDVLTHCFKWWDYLLLKQRQNINLDVAVYNFSSNAHTSGEIMWSSHA